MSTAEETTREIGRIVNATLFESLNMALDNLICDGIETDRIYFAAYEQGARSDPREGVYTAEGMVLSAYHMAVDNAAVFIVWVTGQFVEDGAFFEISHRWEWLGEYKRFDKPREMSVPDARVAT